MKVYIAGPMTGVPQFNIPLFDRVAAELRTLGYDVVSPAELDSPTMRAAALKSTDGGLAQLEHDTKETWGETLARDVRVLSDHGVEGIVLLPNWTRSRGATLEATVGLLNGLKFFNYESDEKTKVSPLGRVTVLSGIAHGFHARWGVTP